MWTRCAGLCRVLVPTQGKTVDGSTNEAVLNLHQLYGVRENMYTEEVYPYPNRNGSPGRETAVYGIM